MSITIDYGASNSSFSCKMLELIWLNKILSFYRHILKNRYFKIKEKSLMQKLKQKKIIIFTLGIFAPLTFTTSKVNESSFGAEIFCTMRDGGNDHESSWEAAYTYIKKQKGGFFKVSPKQAASQITETVIREREKFQFCVEYLDNLHPNRKLMRDLEKEKERKEKEAKEKETKRKRLEKELEETVEDFNEETIDRYSY